MSCRLFALLAALILVAPAFAQQSAADKDAVAKRRLAAMQKALEQLKPSSTAIKSQPALQLAGSPLLRYGDQTRGLLDAGVWRMGQRGRPTALVTLEVYDREGETLLACEVASLTPSRWQLDVPMDTAWLLTPSELLLAPLTGAPPPAESEKARLTQMRQLARRFTVREDLQDDKVECRLLPQPLDRYSDPENKITDAALFAYANGTNPEAGVLIETDGKSWSWGACRLSTAAVFVDLDGKLALEFPKLTNAALPGPYTGGRLLITFEP